MQSETKVHLKDHKRGHQQKMLQCSQCGFKAKYKSELARHNIIHSEEKPFVCTHNGCIYSSSQARNLVSHQLVHSNLKPFKCNLCGKCFRTSSHLNCHIRSHTGERPYKCLYKDCDYSSADGSGLQKHFRRHTGKKPYKCLFNDCEYFSTVSGNLQRHFRRHTGEKPYKCLFNDCEYSSTVSDNLQRHFRIHTGEKPYRCSYEACEYSSVDKSTLKRHMMTHTYEKVHTCSFKNCKYSSIHASYLKSHTNRVHIQNKRHVCQSCEYRSKTAAALRRHVVKNHQKALRTSINRPRLKSSNSSSAIKIESTNSVPHSKLIKGFAVDEVPICVRTFAFVRLTRLKSNSCCYKMDIPVTSTKNLAASRDIIRKTEARPGNSSSAVDDLKLRVPTIVVLERLQVNYDSDDDFMGDSSGVQADLTLPAVPNCIESNVEPQTGPKPKRQKAYLYTCKICDYETKKFEKYKSHLQSHREQRQFFCALCDFVSFKKKHLKSHLRTHDKDSSASDIDRCSDTQSNARVSITSQEVINTNCFGSQSSMNEEIKTRKKVQQNATGKIVLSVTSNVQLQEIRTKRNESLTNPNRAIQAEKKISPQSAEKKHLSFSCIFCNKTFKKEMKLLNHLRYHTGEPRPPHLHY